MPLSGQTVNGQPFSVPKGALALSIFCPVLAGAATYKLQALQPGLSDQDAEVWNDISVFNLGAGGVVPIAAVPQNALTTFPATALGGDVLRMVASADQSGAPTTVPMTWHMGMP